LNELAQIAAFLMNKRLSTWEVDLFHSCVKVRIKQWRNQWLKYDQLILTCFMEEPESSHGFFQR
jgi:hypothetical protein